MSLGQAHPQGTIPGALAQVVQVRDRQRGQALVAGIAIHVVGALQQVSNGRAAHVLIGAIHLHQQRDIAGGVLAGKGRPRSRVALGQGHRGQAVGVPAGDQPGQLWAAVAADVAQIGQQHATLAFVAPGIVEAPQDAADVRVALGVPAVGRKFDLGAGAEKFLDLPDCAEPRLVHVDHHPCDDQPVPSAHPPLPAQAHFSLEIRASFRLIPRWTRLRWRRTAAASKIRL